MLQKLIAIILFLIGVFLFLEEQSFYAIIPVVLGIGLFKGSSRGVWISFESDGGGDSSGCGGDGGGGD